MPMQTGPKLNDLQRMQVKAVIAKLDGRGWSQFQIRDHLQAHLGINISQPMVSIYRKQVYAEVQKDYDANKKESVAVKLEQLRDIRRAAWDAWDRSMEDGHKLVEEYGIDKEAVGEGDYVTSEVMLKRVITKEGRLPDNAYLQTIRATLKDERELLGLDAERAQPTVNNTQVNVVVTGADQWNALVQQMKQVTGVEDRLVQQIEAVEVLDDAENMADTYPERHTGKAE